MTATAYTEVFGGSAEITAAGGTTRLRPETAAYLVTCTTAAQTVQMPPALVGTTPVMPGKVGRSFVVMAKSTNSQPFALKDSAGTTIAATVAAGEVWEVTFLSAATTAGTWNAHRLATSYAQGATIPSNRRHFVVSLSQWSSVQFNLRTHLDSLGYDGVDPASVLLTVESGTFRGSDSIAEPAIDTGTFPTGSFMILINRGTISGMAGSGGRGGDVPPGLLAINGTAGGPALTLRIAHAISNYGVIQGGGGGGGGGAYGGVGAGGGGGGGGGFRWGLGGQPGLSGSTGGAGGAGGNGTVFAGGGGGGRGSPTAQMGGSGGNPGGAGDAPAHGGAGAGGAAGNAVRYLAALGGVTYIVAGTVTGSTVSF